MNIKALALASTLFLAGCANTQDLLDEKPTLAFDTPTKAETIRDCITRPQAGLFAVTPIQDGWLLVLSGSPNGNNAILVVKLTTIGPNTHVETHMPPVGLFGPPEYVKTVDSCLDKLPK